MPTCCSASRFASIAALALAALIAGCAPYPASQPVQPGAAGVGIYGQPVALQVSFGGASMGRDARPDVFPRLDRVIAREEVRTGIRVERYLLPRAGRAGEWTYCMPLRDMAPKRQAGFIAAVREAAQADPVAQVDENQRCGAAVTAAR